METLTVGGRVNLKKNINSIWSKILKLHFIMIKLHQRDVWGAQMGSLCCHWFQQDTDPSLFFWQLLTFLCSLMQFNQSCSFEKNTFHYKWRVNTQGRGRWPCKSQGFSSESSWTSITQGPYHNSARCHQTSHCTRNSPLRFSTEGTSLNLSHRHVPSFS